MLAIQTAVACGTSGWAFWAISLAVVFITYLIGFKLGYQRGKKG